MSLRRLGLIASIWLLSSLLLTAREPRLVVSFLAGEGEVSIFDLHGEDRQNRKRAFQIVEERWQLSFVPMLLEMLWGFPTGDSRARQTWQLIEKKTDYRGPRDVVECFRWLWEQDYQPHPDYPTFKSDRYSIVDVRFRRWFYPAMKHTIRLDEILWGGVRVDGIPPLEHPAFVPADKADYLKDRHVVFGVYLNGEAKAYPKRILAWHELFNDTVGGEDVTCAYCTLCGAAVLYRQQLGDKKFEFGTSGFLYRSNKLMYDRQTHSLWSAIEGRPVTGELAGADLLLERLPIVTTTWGEWRQRHPRTRVLSLETGFSRDYSEGAAYRTYFATDELMFPVPDDDSRLKNKQEILAVLVENVPVAYDTSFLRRKGVYHDRVGTVAIVILNDASGANRVYESGAVVFSDYDRQSRAKDDDGGSWALTEDALVGPSGQKLKRLPSHRAFWFGWRSQFPDTRLVR